jgi:hypothetical protein
MRKLILCLFICAAAMMAANGVPGQSVEQSGMVKTADGWLLVSNQPGNIYTIEIKGLSVKPIPDHPEWFQIDGKFFQIVTALKSQFLKDPGGKIVDEKAILSAHQIWESDYLAETLNRKLKVEGDFIKLANGMTAYAWSYDMPQVADKQTATRQLYLSVVEGDRVLALNTVVEANGDEALLKKLLTDTMSTLKPGDKPLSLEKVREQVLKGK